MDNSIIVKNLPAGVYVPDLSNEFRYFGNILSVSIQYDESKKSGEAYITFDDYFSAVQASKRSPIIKNRPLRVLLSSENEHFKRVFVKNFNKNWDVADLYKAVSDIGSIEDLNISEDKGKSNGYGYVTFKCHSTAKRAVEELNGRNINGYVLQVERFKCKSERENFEQNSLECLEDKLQKSVQYNNLHVKNLPLDLSDKEFSKLFRKFGEISSAVIMTDERGKSKGFGFVCFTKKEDAARALERINGLTLRGKTLHINFKEDGHLRKQYITLKKKALQSQIKQYKQRSQSVPKLIPYALNHKKI